MTLCASCRSAVGEAMFLMVVRRASACPGQGYRPRVRTGHGSHRQRMWGRVGRAAVLNFVIVSLAELEPALVSRGGKWDVWAKLAVSRRVE